MFPEGILNARIVLVEVRGANAAAEHNLSKSNALHESGKLIWRGQRKKRILQTNCRAGRAAANGVQRRRVEGHADVICGRPRIEDAIAAKQYEPVRIKR